MAIFREIGLKGLEILGLVSLLSLTLWLLGSKSGMSFRLGLLLEVSMTLGLSLTDVRGENFDCLSIEIGSSSSSSSSESRIIRSCGTFWRFFGVPTALVGEDFADSRAGDAVT
jgi:hypothetical protein